MTQLFLPLCLASVVFVLTGATPTCQGIEFDAITPDEKGNKYFFKDGYLWKGFHGSAQLVNQTFAYQGRVDAAFLLHSTRDMEIHNRIFLFQDEYVFSYYNNTLEVGRTLVGEKFLGVPCHLDAAVECPKGECTADSVIFFKGDEVYHYDLATRTAKKKTWPQVPACTSAFRWMEHYYCFHGNNFTRFNPMSGLVVGNYPKDARAYFMQCSGFGELPHTRAHVMESPDYMRVDMSGHDLHAFPMSRMWKEAAGGLDAAFSYENKIYLIKGDQVYIYRSGAHYTLVEGYPKTLQEELGIAGAGVNASFICTGEHTVHIIQGNRMVDVDLSATPRTLSNEAPLPMPRVDAVLCGPSGVQVFAGSQYYKYASPATLRQSRIAVRPLPITPAVLPCQD
ncbi:hypothetical protein NHX12_015301 [Muraenolepis orangiensis]|uniref:Hemopexin n=1 Tax=Muraenolepis orangiensis TaxID=630683 RepID=A0A9Q0DBN7_9TELE|nr:hypothetical protein NHX12_015301 [Muraenolepis orangiensis]